MTRGRERTSRSAWLLHGAVLLLVALTALALTPFGRAPGLTATLLAVAALATALLVAGLWFFSCWRSRHETDERRQAEEAFVEQRRELEEKHVLLADAKEKAENAARSKSEFLSSMTHELRTPLGGIVGMANLMLRGVLDEEQRERVKTLRGSCDHLLALVNNVLDLAKIEAGAIELESRPFDLHELVTQLVEAARPEAERRGLKLYLTLDPHTPRYVVGDSMRVSQVLTNLLGNALKFTHEGQVAFGLLRRHHGEETDELMFMVRDTGIGIPKAKQEMLFQAFSQAEVSTTREYGGTGLGLAISRDLVRQMGGELSLESSEGKGSTFSFVLPLPVVDAASVVAQADEDAESLDRGFAELWPLKILVAEDDPVNQKVLADTLAHLGYECDVTGTGAEALAAAAARRYDLLFLDLHMPDMDGFELARRLFAEHKPYDRPRVAALTASATSEVRDRCLSLGMDAYLTKPLQIGELVRVLRGGELVSSGSHPVLSIRPVDGQVTLETSALVGLQQLGAETDRDVAGEIADLFRENTPQRIEALRVAEAAGDLNEVRKIAHQMRGSTGYIGAKKMALVCSSIEDAAAEGDPDEVRQLLGFLDIAYRKSLQALDEKLAK